MSFVRGRSRQWGRPRVNRKIKAFDPTTVINSPQVSQVIPEYTVIHAFTDFPLSGQLQANIVQKGYSTPTPIQDQAIPPIMAGKDLIGTSNTGTGKTAAFLIPLIEKVANDRCQRVLILAPTRELAAQIRDEFYDLSRNLNLYCTLCIGGANLQRQVSDLKRSPQFVVGTPGRLLDMLRLRALNLSGFNNVVLDETDRMVDIGFLKDIQHIISLLPANRQSLFFTATLNDKVKQILDRFVTNPVSVSVKTRETAANVHQRTLKVADGLKVNQLHGLLIQKEYEKVLVFGRTKHGVQRLSDELVKRGFKADAIHGNKRQTQRLKTLERFKRNEIKVLIATDVAARGLDIPNVSHVINYDLPESYETYIHRIGRTGRADKQGIALTFVD